MKKLEFGYKCKDIITGSEGILVVRISCITGCDLVQLRVGEEEKTFNISTIKYVDDGVYQELYEIATQNRFDDLEEALYDFGTEVQDKLTEFKGKIINKSISIAGDISYAVTPKYSKDNRDNNASWFDEGRLKVIEVKKEEVVSTNRTGGIAQPNGFMSR